MEAELEMLRGKHGCDSRLEACLRELDQERRRTAQLREQLEMLKGDLAARRRTASATPTDSKGNTIDQPREMEIQLTGL